MSDSKLKAVNLLDHYISLTMKKAGLNPDSDTRAELTELVDHIVDASCEEAEKRLLEKMKATRNRQSAELRVTQKGKTR